MSFEVVVQGRHEAMLRLERDEIGATQRFALEGDVEPGLGGQGEQRAFGRVALDMPVRIGRGMRMQFGVVAQQRRASQLDQFGMVFDERPRALRWKNRHAASSRCRSLRTRVRR